MGLNYSPLHSALSQFVEPKWGYSRCIHICLQRVLITALSFYYALLFHATNHSRLKNRKIIAIKNVSETLDFVGLDQINRGFLTKVFFL